MKRTPLHLQVDTLPDLVSDTLDPFRLSAADLLRHLPSAPITRVFLTGCGDSYHAPLNAELAFEQLAGIPCEPATALQFSRYGASFVPQQGQHLVVAVSVSGEVSRTVEAARFARQAGALTVALTANTTGPLAAEADLVLETAVPPLPDELGGMIVPGARSYVASQLMLYLLAIALGRRQATLGPAEADRALAQLAAMPALMRDTIALSDPRAQTVAAATRDASQFHFCGAGPNYGTALFSAAKLLEASGDIAVAQDLEEWAHLQYFSRERETPTFLISAGGRDADRASEIAVAARAIGRRVILIGPESNHWAGSADAADNLLTAVPPAECFSPLLLSLPGMLFAAYRAQLIGEPYFRNFSGGRSQEGGGGISRIRTSRQLQQLGDLENGSGLSPEPEQ